MKSRLLSILFLVLCLLFAFVFGAYRGWQKDYAAVEETRISLTDQISTQAETASNILTVAFRHLDRDDESILALTGIRDTLRSHAALADKAAAAKQLAVQAEALLDKLAPLESVQRMTGTTCMSAACFPVCSGKAPPPPLRMPTMPPLRTLITVLKRTPSAPSSPHSWASIRSNCSAVQSKEGICI